MPSIINIEQSSQVGSNNGAELSREQSINSENDEAQTVLEDAMGAEPFWDPDDMFDEFNTLAQRVKATSAGTWATSGTLTDAPSPGLFVHEYGVVGLPLSPRVAEDLKQTVENRPDGAEKCFAEGSPAWALWKTQFELQNPKWTSYVAHLLELVRQPLGFVGSHEDLYLRPSFITLLDRKGRLGARPEVPRDQDTFGYLAVVLPAEHSGGNLRVTFDGDCKRFDCTASSSFDCSYIAWYADAEFSIERILSGYCLVLVYQIQYGERCTKRQNPMCFQMPSLPLEHWCQKWVKQTKVYTDSVTPYVVTVLDHDLPAYTSDWKLLAGSDRLLTKALSTASAKTSVSIFIARLVHTQRGNCTEFDVDNDWGFEQKAPDDLHEIEGQVECHWKLEGLVRPDGTRFAGYAEIDPDGLLQNDVFEDAKPFRERVIHNDEGTQVEHYYYKSCILLLPKHLELNFLMVHADTDFDRRAWMEAKLEEWAKEPSEALQKDLALVSSLVTSGSTYDIPSNDTVGTAMKVACRLGMPELFNQVSGSTTTYHLDDVWKAVGDALASVDFKLWEAGLNAAVAPLERLGPKQSVVWLLNEALRSKDVGDNVLTPVNNWAVNMISAHLAPASDLTIEDAVALVEPAKVNESPYMFQVVLPAIKSHFRNATFIDTTLNLLARAEFNGELPTAVVSNVFHDVLFNLASEFKIQQQTDPAKNRTGGWGFVNPGPSRNQPLQTIGFEGRSIAHFISYGLHFKAHESIRLVLEKISSSASTYTIATFEKVVLPFLQALPNILKQHTIPANSTGDVISHDTIRQLYRTTLKAFICTFVGQRPPRPSNWTQSTVKCRCEHCSPVNTFLRDPERMRYSVAAGQEVRTHLQDQICTETACEYFTISSALPYELVVQKTLREWRKDVVLFGARRNTAADWLENTIGFDNLIGLVGEGITRPLGLCPFVVETLGGARTPLAETTQWNRIVSQPHTNRKTGTKATSGSENVPEVIDLT